MTYGALFRGSYVRARSQVRPWLDPTTLQHSMSELEVLNTLSSPFRSS